MNQLDDTAEPMSLNRTRLVAATLTAMGAILALVSLGWALSRFFELGGNKEAGAADFLGAAAWLTAGLAGGVVLWGVAELLRTLDGMIEATKQKRDRLCTACFSGEYPIPVNNTPADKGC